MTPMPPVQTAQPDGTWLNEAEARQRECDEAVAAEREWAGRHRREQEAHAEAEKINAAVAFTMRAVDEARKRGLSFENPPMCGSGWGSTEVYMVNARAAAFAKEKFTELVQAEEAVEAARKYLAGTSDSATTVGFPVELQDLHHMRSRVDVDSARFDAAYAALNARRALLNDPAFVERIEQLNAVAEAAFFETYVFDGMPEEQAIGDAVRALLSAFQSIRNRHEAALKKNSEGVLLTRQLGIHNLPEQRFRISSEAGSNFASRTMAAVAREWRSSTPGWSGSDIERYFPDWRSPHA